MNKRGQVFSGILVLITLFMCGLSIWMYLIQQETVQSSLVSPLAVLELRDNKSVFEMRENELILDSLKKVDSDFGSDEFLEDFREEFILGINSEMRDFVFLNLVIVDGKSVDVGARDSFLKNVVYRKDGFSWEGSSRIKFERGEIEKKFEMRALEVGETNFAVNADFVFDREYLISKVGNKFVAEVVE